jgi:hypothetical protein
MIYPNKSVQQEYLFSSIFTAKTSNLTYENKTKS